MHNYNYDDLLVAYQELKVQDFQVVLVESDLASLGFFEGKHIGSVPKAHIDSLQTLMGREGTVVVPTASPSLLGTGVPFDVNKTPSERGVLSEYVRRMKGSIRSFHPFNSYTAIGRQAVGICENTSRHAYGPESPMGKMTDLDTLCISIGLRPHVTCSTLHEIELELGIPYRHTKEIVHPVLRDGVAKNELFYLHLWREECDIKYHEKKDLWAQFEMYEGVNVVKVGRGRIYSYSMRAFYKFVPKLFNDNMYILLTKDPEIKPYR